MEMGGEIFKSLQSEVPCYSVLKSTIIFRLPIDMFPGTTIAHHHSK